MENLTIIYLAIRHYNGMPTEWAVEPMIEAFKTKEEAEKQVAEWNATMNAVIGKNYVETKYIWL